MLTHIPRRQTSITVSSPVKDMTVETIDRSEKAAALDVLCEAFHDYPVMQTSLAESGQAYDHHLREMIDLFCENRFGRGRPLYVLRKDASIAAVAVCSGAESIPTTPELQSQSDALDALIGETAVQRLAGYDDLSEVGEPECPHHYLGMLGVRSALRGKGYGRALVDHLKVVVRHDPISEGICLNTETEKNISIYERMGFEVRGEAENDHLHT